MTDDVPSDKPSPERNEELSAEAASEEDIDALLEGASSLAAELAGDDGELEAGQAASPTEEILDGSDSAPPGGREA